MRRSNLPVAIIGAGPVGLAAAAHLLVRNLDCVILEAGASVGNSLRTWGHVRMFSPWRYNIDAASRHLLLSHGWRPPAAEQFPTGRDLITDYLAPLSETPAIASRLRLNAQVTAISRTGLGKVRSAGRDGASFEIRIRDAQGEQTRSFARAVIDASGTWGNPSQTYLKFPTWIGVERLPRYLMPTSLSVGYPRMVMTRPVSRSE